MSYSGGLTYHLRALRYRRGLWNPFVKRVQKWLLDWKPGTNSLLLFGPSAGYSIPLAFLSQFEEIYVIEPDSIARVLLRRRIKRTKIYKRVPKIFFLPQNEALIDPSPQRFFSLIQQYPNACILFSNLLGQLAGEANEHGFRHRPWVLNPFQLEKALESRKWASFHDRFSTNETLVDKNRQKDLEFSNRGPIEVDALARLFLDPTKSEFEINDHETSLFSKDKFQFAHYWVWDVTPTQHHVIEGLIHTDIKLSSEL